MTEFDHSSGSHPDQSHVADKISAIKRKGKPPHFTKQKGAGPSTMTVALFRPQGISYESKSLKQSAQAYTSQTGQLSPSTLMETRALISQLNLDPTIETMKSVESLCNHQEFVEKSTAYQDAIAGEKPSFPPLLLQSRIEEIPELVSVLKRRLS